MPIWVYHLQKNTHTQSNPKKFNNNVSPRIQCQSQLTVNLRTNLVINHHVEHNLPRKMPDNRAPKLSGRDGPYSSSIIKDRLKAQPVKPVHIQVITIK